MATVVKGFETVNLPLTRRKFLSIVKKKRNERVSFLVCFAFSLLSLNLKLLLLVEGAGFLCCCSEVTPFFHCSFFRTFFGSLSCFLSSLMID